MLIVKASDGSGALTRNLILAALDENEGRKTGSETMLAKLSELMFIQALRRHIDSLPVDGHDVGAYGSAAYRGSKPNTQGVSVFTDTFTALSSGAPKTCSRVTLPNRGGLASPCDTRNGRSTKNS
jgi:hypothetical protein